MGGVIIVMVITSMEGVPLLLCGYLNTSFSQVDAEPICVPAVVLHQFLEGPKCCSSSNEETTMV